MIPRVEIPNKLWKPKETQIFVRRNKALKWRDQEIPEGRILTVIAVPNELINDVMAISGKHGLIIGFAKREPKEQCEKEIAYVRLQEDMGTKEALKKRSRKCQCCARRIQRLDPHEERVRATGV